MNAKPIPVAVARKRMIEARHVAAYYAAIGATARAQHTAALNRSAKYAAMLPDGGPYSVADQVARAAGFPKIIAAIQSRVAKDRDQSHDGPESDYILDA